MIIKGKNIQKVCNEFEQIDTLMSNIFHDIIHDISDQLRVNYSHFYISEENNSVIFYTHQFELNDYSCFSEGVEDNLSWIIDSQNNWVEVPIDEVKQRADAYEEHGETEWIKY